MGQKEKAGPSTRLSRYEAQRLTRKPAHSTSTENRYFAAGRRLEGATLVPFLVRYPLTCCVFFRVEEAVDRPAVVDLRVVVVLAVIGPTANRAARAHVIMWGMMSKL